MGPAFPSPKSAENRLNAEAIVNAGDARSAWCAPTSQRSPMAVPITPRADKSATEKRRARGANVCPASETPARPAAGLQRTKRGASAAAYLGEAQPSTINSV